MKNILRVPIILMMFVALTIPVKASIRAVTPCDTLITVEGKVYLVTNVEIRWKEVHFSTCDDATRVYAIPQNRIASIRKAPMPRIHLPQLSHKPIAAPKRDIKSSSTQLPPIPVDTAAWMAKRALKLGVTALALSLTVVLAPIGFIVGVFALARATQGFNFIENRPTRRKIKRKLRLALALGIFSLLPIVALIALLAAAQKSWGDFDFDFDLDNWGGGFVI